MSRSSANRDIGAGEMRHLVVVERPTYTDDGNGGQITLWAEHCRIYCMIKQSQRGEQYSDGPTGQIRSLQSWTFVTWNRRDIKVTDRLNWKGELFNIRDADNLNLNSKYLEIKADSGVEQ